MSLITHPADPWAGHADPLTRNVRTSAAPPAVVRCVRLREGATGYLCCEEPFDPSSIHGHLAGAHDLETADANKAVLRALVAHQQGGIL